MGRSVLVGGVVLLVRVGFTCMLCVLGQPGHTSVVGGGLSEQSVQTGGRLGDGIGDEFETRGQTDRQSLADLRADEALGRFEA